MRKRAIMTLLALMAVPTLSSAATYWAVTATTSPAALKTNLTAARPANFGNYTTPGGATKNLTNVTKSTLPSVNFDVAAVAGYTVKVKVDGVQIGTVPGTYTITKNSVLNRSIVATYSAASFVISTSPANGGTISGSQTAAASTSPSVSLAPIAGYTLTGAKIDGTVYALADTLPAGVTVSGNSAGAVYTFPAVSAAHSIQGVFALTPAATAIIANGAAATVAPGASFIIDGSSSVSNVAASYAWTATCGTLTANVNPKLVTFTAPASNATSCTATLTLTAAGVSPNPVASMVITTGSPVATATQICLDCHNGSGGPNRLDFAASVHMGKASCQACHNPSGTLSHAYLAPATITCTPCHSGGLSAASLAPVCNSCHGGTDIHGFNKTAVAGLKTKCIECHAAVISHPGDVVKDNNNGVRAITTEFAKWSHHVTGVTLDDAHCAACHLEGKVVAGEVVVDPAKHMADAQTHLRNADTDADMAWDPAAPNHSTIDNFCMSCHDADGATSTVSQAIQANINTRGIAAVGKTASAKNPFGDTISNRYDKMQRPGVTNVDSQFNTTNNSHHGVKGARYSGRTRAAGARQIASPTTFANNSSALLQGKRSTMYDAGNLNQLYTPLENAGGEVAPRTGAATLGDDSTLHCGDCHTVGQWKVGSSETANGSATPVAIGAHGSNNEYMLRNSIGSDERHTQNAFLQGNITGNVLDPATGLPIPNGVVVYTNPTAPYLVCYNCHNYNKYGSIFLATGVLGGHAGEYDAQGRCNGIGNTLPFGGYTTGTATDGTQFASRFMGPVTKYSTTVGAPVGEQNPDFGNIYGIQCLNCHNSGIGNAYGGIHGSANNTEWNNGTTVIVPNASVTGGAYVDGMGNTTKVERFLPGLGNVMHVPGTLGGFTGGTVVATFTGGPAYTYVTSGISNDTNWEQKHWQQTAGMVINNTTGALSGTAAAARGAGCYTLGATEVTGAAIKTSDVSSGLEGPSVTGEAGGASGATDVWGGCDDHTAGQAKGNHGFLKKIVRPVTY
jgi:hypothetical protein